MAKTLKIGKREFPFVPTPKLKDYVKEAGIDISHIGVNKHETRRFAFLACKAACESKGENFSWKFEEFINLVEPEVFEKSKELAKELV